MIELSTALVQLSLVMGTTYPSFFPSSPTHTENPISLQYILVNDSVLFIVLEYSCIR